MGLKFGKPGACNGCGNTRLIASAKYGLCSYCNSKRLSADKKPKPAQWLKKARKPISQKSEARRLRDEALKQARAAVVARDLPKCSGCGRWYSYLSFSHIVPVGQRQDLEANPQNIVFDCLTVGRVNPVGAGPNDLRGCHDIWEHGTQADRERLLNYRQRIQIIKELAPEKYRELVYLKEKI
jgi:hypothetical protein